MQPVQPNLSSNPIGRIWGRNRSAKRRVLLISACVSLSNTGVSYASQYFYTNTTSGGSWNTAANWTLNASAGTHAVPVAGDDALLGMTGTGNFTSIYNGSYAAALSSFTINATAPSTFAFIQNTATTLIGGHETIGSTTYGNIYNQSAGTNNISGGLVVGSGSSSATAQGTYLLSGGNVLGGNEFVGQNATTTDGGNVFNQSGGTNSPLNITVGGIGASVTNGTGLYLMSGGNLTTGQLVIANSSGSGTFAQSGTAVTTISLNIIVGQSGSGIFNFSGGTVSMNGTSSIQIGQGGTGVVNHTAGSVNFSGSGVQLQVGNGASPGTYNLGGTGVLNGASDEEVGYGGTGTFVQNGGNNALASGGGLNVGATGIGNYNLNGGTLTASYIGLGGSTFAGTLNQTGGTLNSDTQINVNNHGTFALAGGVANLSSFGVDLQILGGGNFVHTAGSLNNTNGAIAVGAGGTGSANYYLSGTGQVSAYSAATGYISPGTLNQSGGVFSVSNTETIGGSSSAGVIIQSGGNHSAGTLGIINGSYSLSGTGYLTAVGEYVGGSGTGTFTQTGGTNVPLGTGLDLGTSASTSVGVYTLNSGNLQPTALTVGTSGTGTFIQNGGLTAISALLSVGAGSGVNNNSVTLTGGTLNVGTGEFIGQSNFGSFIQTAGAHNVTGTIFIASSNALTAGSFFNISGGTTTAGGINISQSGTLNLLGGTVTTGFLSLAGGTSRFNWSAGELALSSAITFDATASPTSTAGVFGSSYTLNSGMTLLALSTQTIGGSGPFTLTVNAGGADLSNGTTTIANNGTVIINGGTFQNPTNKGLLVATGAVLIGTMNNQATANFSNAITITGGLANSGIINLSSALVSASSAITNSGLIFGYGSVGSLTSSFSNSSVITESGGNLQFTTQSGFSNTGTLNGTAGLTLSITGTGAATNDGTINLNNGTLSGTLPLTNDVSGVIVGPGKITSTPFVNNGTIEVPNGTTQAGGFTNSGVIEMAGSAAVLGLGGTITNTATIEGFGKITDAITNSGTMEPTGGTLVLAATLTNPAAGTIRTVTGTKVLLQGSIFPSNAGLIDLAGGTFDTGGQTLTNTGQISGYGVISTGGLTNNGIFTLTGGTATINGPFTNALNFTTLVQYQPAIFTGTVINNGAFNVSNTTVTFAAGWQNNGTYSPDPSTSIFQSSLTNNGTMTGDSGDVYLLKGGTFTNGSTFTDAGTLTSNDNVTNSSVFTQTGPQSWAVGTTFTNTGGTATFGSDAGASGANLSVVANGGTVKFTSTQHLANLTIGTGALTQITGGGIGHRSVVFTPALSVTGTLDLTNNDLDVQGGNISTITALVGHSFSNGNWTGTGITSSSAANDPAHLTALGTILNNSIYTTLDGATVAANDVLVKYTYYGDANLSGKVDGSDYSLIDSGYVTHATGWYNGDFNYDNVINGSDYTLIDNAFNTQGAQLTSAIANPLAAIATQVAGSSSVPEPTTISLLGIASAGLLVRRRSPQKPGR